MSTFQPSKLILTVSLLVLLITTACNTPTPAPKATDTPVAQAPLTISGSGTVTTILGAVQAPLEADVPSARFKILAGSGTTAGIKGVMEKTLDIVGMARAVKEDEASKGLKGTIFGSAGIGIVAHPAMSVSNLTKAQVADIFMGKVTNWSAVGGPDQTIVVYVRDEDESATQVLRKAIFGTDPFPKTTAKVLTSAKDMIAAVTGTQYSIGFVSWPAVMATGTTVKPLSVDGVLPREITYPWTVPLGLGYLESRQADVKPLMDWLASEKGHTALRKIEVIIAQ